MWKTLTTRYFIPPVGSSPLGTGVAFAAVWAITGLICLINGNTFFYNRWGIEPDQPSVTWVTGTAAVLGAFFYICIGLYFHFSYYWSEKSHLEKYSPILSNTALIVGLILGCWGVFG